MGLGGLLANRAQTWVRAGNLEKALADGERGNEVAPTNAKCYFRKGIALHSLNRGKEALEALGEAERLEGGPGKNKQITDALGMVSLKMRRDNDKEQAKYRP